MLHFRTYFKDVSRAEEKVKLKGLEHLTARQLFWLANGVQNCEKKRPFAQGVQLQADPHLPKKFRVLGPVTNIQEFSKDWNCPEGSTHNPDKRCTLW